MPKSLGLPAIAMSALVLSGCSSLGSLFECDGYTETVYVQTQRCTAGYSSTGHCNGWTYGQKPVKRCVRTPKYDTPSVTKPKTPSAQEIAQQGTQAFRQGDDAKAVRLWRRAAEGGNSEGQAYLGWAYLEGRGVEQNDTEALRWYRLAIAQHEPFALHGLGTLYLHGQVVEQDEAEALRLIQLAANQNYAPAEYALGWMYENGRGVTQNLDQAISWYRRAAKNGDGQAIDALQDLGVSL